MIDDQELLKQIVLKKEPALKTLYERYADTVYRFAFKTLKNEVEANEVLHEVMMEVWNKAESFKNQSKVKTWLLSITHHKAVDLIRKQQRHHHDELDEMAIDTESNCSLFDLQANSENKQHIEHCMSKLKQGHRQVVFLTFFEGLSYSDIANTLGIPSGTVKTRMLHAKGALLNCLQQFISPNTI